MKDEERKNTIDKIINYSKELRLPAIRRNILQEIKEAEKKNLSYQDFLCGLLLKEYDLRVENGKKNRIRAANFPYKKYIEDLSIEDLPHDGKKKAKGACKPGLYKKWAECNFFRLSGDRKNTY